MTGWHRHEMHCLCKSFPIGRGANKRTCPSRVSPLLFRMGAPNNLILTFSIDKGDKINYIIYVNRISLRKQKHGYGDFFKHG